jgi:hypothetical protein
MGFIRRLDRAVDLVTGHGAAIGEDRLGLLVRFMQSSHDGAYNRAEPWARACVHFNIDQITHGETHVG